MERVFRAVQGEHGSATRRTLTRLSALQALLTELAAIRSQEATLLEEMEVLRNVAEVDALPDPEPVVPTPQKMVIAAARLPFSRHKMRGQLHVFREQM